MQAFSTTEYRARVDNLRALMTDKGLDALLVLSSGNMCYLTGYDAWSSYVPQAALITHDEDPYLILRAMDLLNIDGTWLESDHIIPYDESYIGAADKTPWTAIGDFTRRRVAAGARVGAELSGTGLGVVDYRHLVSALGGEDLQDAIGLIATLKRVKSDQELLYISEAAVIGDAAIRAGVDKIAVGVRQCDVAAAVMAVMCGGTDTIPGSPPMEPVAMPTGSIANAPHLKWSDEVYATGQQTNFELGAFRRRYGAAVSRTTYLGTAPQQLNDLHAGVLDGFLAAEESLRPGVRCSDVAANFQAAIAPHGLTKASRLGYSVGIDWIDGGASLAPWDDTVIVPNMALHIIIGIWETTKGYVFSESFQTTTSSARRLSSLPRTLIEIPA